MCRKWIHFLWQVTDWYASARDAVLGQTRVVCCQMRPRPAPALAAVDLSLGSIRLRTIRVDESFVVGLAPPMASTRWPRRVLLSRCFSASGACCSAAVFRQAAATCDRQPAHRQQPSSRSSSNISPSNFRHQKIPIRPPFMDFCVLTTAECVCLFRRDESFAAGAVTRTQLSCADVELR